MGLAFGGQQLLPSEVIHIAAGNDIDTIGVGEDMDMASRCSRLHAYCEALRIL